MVSYPQSKLIAMDNPPDADGMPLGRVGKAGRLTPEAFAPGAQREVLPQVELSSRSRRGMQSGTYC